MGTIGFANGSASAPSLNNTGDTNSGIFFPADNMLGVATNGNERVRVDNFGRFLIGKTSPNIQNEGVEIAQDGETKVVRSGTGLMVVRNGTDGDSVEFKRGLFTVGSISVTGSATAYNTSSDYRLKTDIKLVADPSTRLLKLKPINFAWIVDGTRTDGFLAHELAEEIPDATTGEKDATKTEEYETSPAVYREVTIEAVIDENGNEVEAERTETELVSEAVTAERTVPDYQGIDQAKIVPLLVAALQDALKRIAVLENGA
jgi:hypothetical protein